MNESHDGTKRTQLGVTESVKLELNWLRLPVFGVQEEEGELKRTKMSKKPCWELNPDFFFLCFAIVEKWKISNVVYRDRRERKRESRME